MPIAVLSEYAEKEYEPFDSYSRFCPAMSVSVCFSDTALYTLSKSLRIFVIRVQKRTVEKPLILTSLTQIFFTNKELKVDSIYSSIAAFFLFAAVMRE